MNDMERRKFEDSFQDAFKDAEMNPSENVWTNIELDLERAAGDNMKRRIVFFKMLAAASVIFALCVGGVTYYILSDSQKNTSIAQQRTDDVNSSFENQQPTPSETEDAQVAAGEQAGKTARENAGDVPEETRPGTSPDPNLTQQEKPKGNRRPGITSGNNIALADGSDAPGKGTNSSSGTNNRRTSVDKNVALNESGTSTKTPLDHDNDQIINSIRSNIDQSSLTSENLANTNGGTPRSKAVERKLPAFYEPVMPELELPVSSADPGMVLLARLADEEKRYASAEKAKKNVSEKLWTSVGFAAGAFDANNPSVTPPPSNSLFSLTANTVTTAAKQSKASGTSYSLGVNMGTKISERWVVQGGINYLTQSSDYTANSVVVIDNNYGDLKAESLNAFTGQTADASAQPKVAQTFPYNVNNNVRFVSVPVQAGYLLLNRKFGVQLNAGVSTDLFLQNTITPDGGGVTKTTQGRGDDSPYRSLNFSGLMGTELSYKLGSKYRVSLNPGLRYPLRSVYKDSMGIDATPLTFDVGLRFRYIFH